MSIQFVGDLSVQDAKILAYLGKHAPRILEFGVGGSTQIFAQCQPEQLVSVETDPAWVARTQDNLQRIDGEWTQPKFVPYDLFDGGEFDLIFVDGVPDKRLEFAMRAWPMLAVDGCMVFHDTRRFEYFREAAWVMQSFFNAVGNVSVNTGNSNLTVIEKIRPLMYENWNDTENKPPWAYGKAEIPEGERLWRAES